METKQSSLPTKKTKRLKKKDLCPVCDFNLYFNSKVTQRIGVMDSTKDIVGWICPDCSSEFDLNDNILYIYGENSTQGIA